MDISFNKTKAPAKMQDAPRQDNNRLILINAYIDLCRQQSEILDKMNSKVLAAIIDLNRCRGA